MHIAQTRDGVNVRLVLRVGHRIAEKQHKVDLVVGDARGNLLLAALHAGQTLVDLEAGRLLDELAGRAGRADIMLCQNTAVCHTELNHQFFFAVMCDECYIHFQTSPSLSR